MVTSLISATPLIIFSYYLYESLTHTGIPDIRFLLHIHVCFLLNFIANIQPKLYSSKYHALEKSLEYRLVCLCVCNSYSKNSVDRIR